MLSHSTQIETQAPGTGTPVHCWKALWALCGLPGSSSPKLRQKVRAQHVPGQCNATQLFPMCGETWGGNGLTGEPCPEPLHDALVT